MDREPAKEPKGQGEESSDEDVPKDQEQKSSDIASEMLKESKSNFLSPRSDISNHTGPPSTGTKYVSFPRSSIDDLDDGDHEGEKVVQVQRLSDAFGDPYSDTSEAVSPPPERPMPKGKKRRKELQPEASFHTVLSGTSSDDDPEKAQQRSERKGPRKKSGSDASLESDAQPLRAFRNENENPDDISLDRSQENLGRDGERRSYPSKGLGSFTSRLRTNLKSGNAFVFMVKPPDGGYGWFVMLISFLCQVVVDGIIFSIGITLPFMATDFNLDQSQAVLIASMQIGFYFLSGPVSSALINSYGFRPVALLGAGIASISILIATFMQGEAMMILFYSIIGGPALSMVWVSSQLIIGYYFEKYRPIANGISCSGAGAGILIFSAMNGALVPNIGWRNTSRVHICFLCIVFLMVLTFIEVKPTLIGQYREAAMDTESESSDQYDVLGTYRYSRASAMSRKSFPTVPQPPAANVEKLMIEYDDDETQNEGCIRSCLRTCCPKLAKRLRDKERISDVPLGGRTYIIQPDPIERKDLYYTGPAEYNNDGRSEDMFDQMQIQLDNQTSSEKAKSLNYTLSMYAVRPSKAPPPQVRSRWSPAYWVHPKIRNAFSLLFDFRLLRMMEFQILLASAFLFPMGFNIPFVYSKVRADIPLTYAVLVPSAIGFSNFLFRVVSGFVAYKYKEYTTYICGSGITFGGIFVFISAFYGVNVIWFQFLYAVCYGVAPAFYSTLRAIIYVRTLGLDKLTNAFGLTAMSMGLGVFLGTTMAGILNQHTGDYNASFMLSGICIMAAGILKLILPFILKWKFQKEELARKVKFDR